MKARVAAIALALLAAAVAGALAVIEWRRAARAEEGLRQRLSQRVTARPQAEVSCVALAQRRPLVLLALGQSNAGNHGLAAPGSEEPIFVFTDQGKCYLTADPLPGATGKGASIWSRLPAALAQEGVDRPLLLAVLAVDASSMREWTDARGPLPALLDDMGRALGAAALPPALVLWQQGEADARAGTAAAAYQQGLLALAGRLRAAGISAPLVLARSTRCRGEPAEPLRAAMAQLAATDPHFILGPDTDDLMDAPYRSDGCHFGPAGLQVAAERWARSVAPLLR